MKEKGMLICKVVGHVWATNKDDGLNGLKLMVVQEIDGGGQGIGHTFVAADIVGAGIGERVLTVGGSTARKAFGHEDIPVDCAIVAIIDSLEIVGQEKDG